MFPNFGVGGAELLLVGVMNAIGPRFAHSVLAVYGDYSAAELVDPKVGLRTLGVFARGNGVQIIWRMRRLLEQVRPDLVATYNWGAFDMVLGGRPGAPCPFIHNEHGFGDDEELALKARRVWTRRLTLNRLYTTIVPSETLKRIALEQYRVRPARLTVIPNGVDTDHFQPGREAGIRQQFGIPEAATVFCFTGALRREKNLSLLVDAFADAALETARLLIVGDGPCREELTALAAARGVADRIHFVGRATEIRRFLHSADVFVMSSNTEQASMALLEAMACGLPCLTTDVGDSAAMLGHPGAPFVVPRGDQAAYAAALRALADPAHRGRTGDANRRRCCELYTKAAMVARYEETWIAALRTYCR